MNISRNAEVTSGIGRKASFRLFSFFSCALTIVLALAAGSGAARATIAPAPLGLDVDGTEFSLQSNHSSAWKVSVNGGAFEPVKLRKLIRAASSGARSATDRQPYGYIWAATCTAAQQTLKFRRSYYLPGRPKTLAASLSDTTFAAAPANRAISSAKIYINGKLAFSAAGAYLNTGSPAALVQARYFVFGYNTIDVVVVKRLRNGTYGQCKTSSNPPLPLALAFIIQGKYEADLWLSANSSVPQEFWKRVGVDENYHQLFVVGVTPKNLGPSGIYRGKLVVNFSGENLLVELKATISGTGLRNCVVTQPSSSTARMECDIYRMPAGTSVQASFRAATRIDRKFDVVYTFIRSDATTTTADPQLKTNGWRRYYYFCSKSSTDARCPA
jgi:hypothetical protein